MKAYVIRWVIRIAIFLNGTLRKDAFFYLAIAIGLVGLLVPQIWNVVTDTVKPNDPRSLPDWEDLSAVLTHKATVEATGFLIYLSLLATVCISSVIFVVPPSWKARDENPGRPRELAKRPVWVSVSVAVLLLIGVAICAIYPIWPIVPIMITVAALFKPVSRLISHWSGWLNRRVIGRSQRQARIAGSILLVGGAAFFLFMMFQNWVRSPYSAAGAAGRLFSFLTAITGVWLLLLPASLEHSAQLGPVRTAHGRLLGWLFPACLFGEIVWLLAFVPYTNEFISLRLYTMWAALMIPTFLVVVGSLADTWDGCVPAPMRLVTLMVAGGLFVYAAMPVPLKPLAPLAPNKDLEKEKVIAAEEWPQLFLERIKTVDEGQPVLFVSASGGGSRAAIFADLVLEFLLREPLVAGDEKKGVWANHVALISGVSGGSLGAAVFVHRLPMLASPKPANEAPPDKLLERADLNNSVKAELLVRLKEGIDRLEEQINDSGHAQDKYKQAMKDLKKVDYLYLPKTPPLDPHLALSWMMRSALVDDLCTDFMAPIFRGAISPGISRGQTLRTFWAEQFEWGTSADRYGYAVRAESPKFDAKVRPLAVFNAADVRRGSRLAIGFPPLPARLLMDATLKNPNDAASSGGGNGPETLADLNPNWGITLADAVGMSANFPFGFNVGTIPRETTGLEKKELKSLEEHDDLLAKILDGGVTDNSGVDTIYLILKSIHMRAKWAIEKKDMVYKEIVAELRKRRVHLVIIDSGAKPEKPGFATKHLSVVLDPLGGLNNAGYTNASLATERNVVELAAMMHVEVDLRDLKAKVDPNLNKPILDKLDSWQNAGVNRFSKTIMDSNHLSDENVLTAWSLAPKDKAVLLARFLLELHVARRELIDLGAAPPMTADREVAEIRKNASSIVDEASLAKAQANVAKNLAAQMAPQAKENNPDKILQIVADQEKHLDDAEKLAATLPAAGRATFQASIKELKTSANATREAVKKTPNAAGGLYDKFCAEQTDILGKASAEIEEKRQTTQSSIDKLNYQGQLQKKFDERAREAKILFDPPRDKK